MNLRKGPQIDLEELPIKVANKWNGLLYVKKQGKIKAEELRP